MTSIQSQILNLNHTMDNSRLTPSSLKSIESRVTTLGALINRSGTNSNVSRFMELRDKFDAIKSTLSALEGQSTQHTLHSEVSTLMELGKTLSLKHDTRPLSLEEVSAYTSQVYKLYERDLNSGEIYKDIFKSLLQFVALIHQPSTPLNLQGECVFAEGDMNQFTIAGGSNSTCASNAMNFIAHTLNENPDDFTSQTLFQIIETGKILFDSFLLPARLRTLNTVANTIGASQGEAAKHAFLLEQSGHAMAPVDVMEPYRQHLGERPVAPFSTKLPNNDADAITTHFHQMIDTQLKTHLSQGKKVAATINLNGYTYAMTIKQEGPDVYKFYIFDSHGSQQLNGTRAGFMYKTDSQDDAVKFLSRLIPIKPSMKDKSLEPSDLNTISYSIIKQATPMHPPLQTVVSLGIQMTVLGISALGAACALIANTMLSDSSLF